MGRYGEGVKGVVGNLIAIGWIHGAEQSRCNNADDLVLKMRRSWKHITNVGDLRSEDRFMGVSRDIACTVTARFERIKK